MTYLIIHSKPSVREKTALQLINKLSGRDFTSIISTPDIHIMQTKKTGSIGIDEVKELQNQMKFQPYELPHQFGIILNADDLTAEAQNALLKTLEEESEFCVYILMTKSEKNLLPTVVSRCQKVYPREASQQYSETGELPAILAMDLVDQFNYIAKIADGDDATGAVKELVNSILVYLNNELKGEMVKGERDSSQLLLQKINAVNTALERLESNASKKLILENLILTIN